MEVLTTVISFGLLVALVISPILLILILTKLKLKNRFIIYLFLGATITSALTLLFAWWSDASTEILLSHYGYDYYGMNDTERYGNVFPENMKRVQELEMSMLGVGWPVKTFMAYGIYSPYLIIVYLIFILLKKLRNRQNYGQ